MSRPGIAENVRGVGKKAKEKEMNRKEEQRKERPSFFLVFEDSFCEDV